jgi:hypothetical protein
VIGPAGFELRRRKKTAKSWAVPNLLLLGPPNENSVYAQERKPYEFWLNVPPDLNHAVSKGSTNKQMHCLASMVGYPPSDFLILSAGSRDLPNPLPPPSRRLEGTPEILCFVDDLAVGRTS